jgi:hypothetical protein
LTKGDSGLNVAVLSTFASLPALAVSADSEAAGANWRLFRLKVARLVDSLSKVDSMFPICAVMHIMLQT